jgi:heme-degrading monooxygenase HmoA
MEPRQGQIVTVFRSRLRADGADAYGPHAARMGDLAAQMPGYVEHKIFVAPDGERVTLVTFADRESHNGWRDHPEHRAAQRAGLADYYETYSISVGPVEYASYFVRSEGPAALRHPGSRAAE